MSRDGCIMDAELESEVLNNLVNEIEKCLIAYSPDGRNDYVKGAYEIIRDAKSTYQDSYKTELTDTLRKRLVRSMREDVCYLFFNLHRIFDSVIGWRGLKDE